MRQRLRLYAAGLLAVLLGVPLTEQAFAQTSDIAGAAIDLGTAISRVSGGS
jgi:hypothetical protein